MGWESRDSHPLPLIGFSRNIHRRIASVCLTPSHIGAPNRIQTCDIQLRRLMLCSTELWMRNIPRMNIIFYGLIRSHIPIKHTTCHAGIFHFTNTLKTFKRGNLHIIPYTFSQNLQNPRSGGIHCLDTCPNLKLCHNLSLVKPAQPPGVPKGHFFR